MITQHDRRGSLHAALGDVSFFPLSGGRRERTVAVAGMGRPGTFDGVGLRRLVSGLVVAVSALPPAQTVCAVLIGSGEGTLSAAQAVRSWLDGLGDAADEITSTNTYATPVRKLMFAELDRGRAEDILEALSQELPERGGNRRGAALLRLDPRLRRGSGGQVSVEESVARMTEALLRAAVAEGGSNAGRAFATVLAESGPNATVRKLALERLLDEAARRSKARRPRFRVERRRATARETTIPARLSFWDDGATIRAAAIHEAATVPERLVGVGRDVVDDLVAKMTDPAADDVDELCQLLQQLVVPGEFRDVLRSGSLVFEVDRGLARLHWEMQPDVVGTDSELVPISVRKPVRAAAADVVQPDADATDAVDRRAARARDRRPG